MASSGGVDNYFLCVHPSVHEYMDSQEYLPFFMSRHFLREWMYCVQLCVAFGSRLLFNNIEQRRLELRSTLRGDTCERGAHTPA